MRGSGSAAALLALLCVVSGAGGRSAGCSTPSKGPIVAALLDLHTDEKCSKVDPRGLQQLAALEHTLDLVNTEFREEGIQIVLQVFDTCSSAKVAIASALKALVSSKQTCLHPPLFLGFIGPERFGSMQVVRNLTEIFDSAHVLPYRLPYQHPNASDHHDLLYVAEYPAQQFTKAVMGLATRLGWKSVAIIFEDSAEARVRAQHLVASISSSHAQHPLCLTHHLVQVRDGPSLRSALNNKINSDGVIILLDNIQWSFSYLRFVEDLPNQIILSLSKIGLRSWELSCRNHSIFLLLQVSGAPMSNLNKMYDAYLLKLKNDQDFAEYRQMCKQDETYDCSNDLIVNSLSNEQDWTVNLMQYGMMLFGAALRVGHYTKCKSASGNSTGVCPQLNAIHPSEWNAMLAQSTVFVRPSENSPANKKIAFRIEHSPRFNVYTSFMMDNLEKVAWIDDNAFFVAPWYKFPAVRGDAAKCEEEGGAGLPPPMEATTSTGLARPDRGLLDVLLAFEEYGLYETIAIMAGVGAASVLAIFLLICLVYKTFKVGSNRNKNSYSENSSRSRRGSSYSS